MKREKKKIYLPKGIFSLINLLSLSFSLHFEFFYLLFSFFSHHRHIFVDMWVWKKKISSICCDNQNKNKKRKNHYHNESLKKKKKRRKYEEGNFYANKEKISFHGSNSYFLTFLFQISTTRLFIYSLLFFLSFPQCSLLVNFTSEWKREREKERVRWKKKCVLALVFELETNYFSNP